MKAIKTLVTILSVAIISTACTQTYDQYGQPNPNPIPNINKGTIGGILGAAGGAVIGSNVGSGTGRIAAIAIGTLLGQQLGSSVGGSLDQADMGHYNKTSQQALETGRTGQNFPWNNPNSSASGNVTPKGYYQKPSGQYCREYTQSVNIGGRIEEAYGQACRQPDGTWKIAKLAR